MKKRCLQIIFLLTCCLPSTLRPAVVWTNTVDSHNSVINDDLEIKGDITFQGSQPITIRVDNGNTYSARLDRSLFIQGDGSKVPLNILVLNGRFKFIIDKDLLFKGLDRQPFFMTVAGGGTLEFEIHGDQKLVFDSAPADKSGALFFITMQHSTTPIVEFTRAGDMNKHVEVVIGKNSVLGFMGETPVESATCFTDREQGVMRFITGNPGVGRYVVRIQDRGAFVITGQHKKGGGDTPNVTHLDRATPAHGSARVEIINDKGEWAAGSLLVINSNKEFSRLLINPFDEMGGYTGELFGFILGSNGVLQIGNNAYLDYVGTALNAQPTPRIPEDILRGRLVSDVVRNHNASAFIVDGFDSVCARNAHIIMDGTSAMYFRSGVDSQGDVEEKAFDEQENEVFSFIVDADKKNKHHGNVVLDVEGPLDVQGSPELPTAINILSLQVKPTGGTVAVGEPTSVFPRRTFERDIDNQLLTYNKADFLINNRMNLFNTVLRHDDRCHEVFEKNSPHASEPTYLGGETHLLSNPKDYTHGTLNDTNFPRPRLCLYNSRIDFHESAAFMGVDIFVPNLIGCDISGPTQGGLDEVAPGTQPQDNISTLRFYNNGRYLDNGTGRQLILGTKQVYDCNGLVNYDAHLDIIQELGQEGATTQELRLEVAENDATIREEIADQEPIANQLSIHTVFLGNSSNISIGAHSERGVDAHGLVFTLTTKPTLHIVDDFFSFETQGGPEMMPEFGGTTGKGAIFVDANGVLKIANKRANFSTMVVRNHNGVVDLPKRNVFFHPRVGITNWQPNLTAQRSPIVVKPGESFSKYTLDWINVRKDAGNFAPHTVSEALESVTSIFCDTLESVTECFLLQNASSSCQYFCDEIDIHDIATIPCVQGEVDQLQIKRSRLGDQAHIKVDGAASGNAKIRELLFLTGHDSAEAPVAVVVLQGGGRVGLGALRRYVDSIQASTVLGINGVTLIANGEGVVDLNEDLIVDNMCHILSGPHSDEHPKTITFCSNVPRAIRVKSTGVFNLSQLGDGQTVRFAGEARLVLEPGARILFSPNASVRPVLEFDDTAQLRFDCNAHLCKFTHAPDVTATDPCRAKISGTGRIVFRNDAQMVLLANNILGIESDPDCVLQTDIIMEARDNASLLIGPAGELGGALQVGNTTEVKCGFVRFELILDGLGANLQINSEGFFGIGAGIVRKPSGPGTSPSNTEIGALQQVNFAKINLIEGTLQHNIIESSNIGVNDDERPAGLLAFGPVMCGSRGGYALRMANLFDIRILGGGNIINIGPRIKNAQTIISTTDGLISGSVAAGNQVQVGTLSSLNVFLDNGQLGGIRNQIFPRGISTMTRPNADVSGLSGDAMYGILKTPSLISMQRPRGNIAIGSLDTSTVNYVFNGTIFREVVNSLTGPLGIQVEAAEAHDKGTVGLELTDAGGIESAQLILTQ